VAEAARDLPGVQVKAMVAGPLDAMRDADTGRFLKLQQDAVRQRVTGEANVLHLQGGQLRDQVSRLLIENDQYRRKLLAHRRQSGPR
jgi:hypothetical protein